MTADPDATAAAILGKSTWPVLALTCFVEIFTQAHYVHSIRDGEYFNSCAGVYLDRMQSNAVKACLLKAYRLQYIVSGVRIERFQRALESKTTPQQRTRIEAAIAPLIAYVEA